MQAVSLTSITNCKGGSILTFHAGQRLLAAFSRFSHRERTLSSLVGAGGEEHVSKIEKMQRDWKDLDKKNVLLQKEIATTLAASLVENAEQGVAHVHRVDGDNNFFKAVSDSIISLGEAANKDCKLCLMTAGDVNGVGAIYLCGEQALVNKHGKEVANALDGRGGGKTAFQGKVKDLSKLGEALSKLRLDVANA